VGVETAGRIRSKAQHMSHAVGTAAEGLLEVIMRRYERASTLLTSNRPLAIGASCSATWPPWPHSSIGCSIMRMCPKCGPRRWRTKVQTDLRTEEATK